MAVTYLLSRAHGHSSSAQCSDAEHCDTLFWEQFDFFRARSGPSAAVLKQLCHIKAIRVRGIKEHIVKVVVATQSVGHDDTRVRRTALEQRRQGHRQALCELLSF